MEEISLVQAYNIGQQEFTMQITTAYLGWSPLEVLTALLIFLVSRESLAGQKMTQAAGLAREHSESCHLGALSSLCYVT
jgi:hypothetical protein